MNDLSVIDPVEQQRLKEAMGLATNTGNATVLPRIKINTDFEDDDGNEIPPGSIYLTDVDKTVYGKNFKFRALGNHYQYVEYDPEQNKTVCKTTINKSMFEDFLDTRGTMKCGMTKPKKKMEAYEKERFKNVTCFRQLRGLVSYIGVDAQGNEHIIENSPAIILLKGSNFMPFEDEVVKKLPRGSDPSDFWLDVSLERLKNGSVVYYVMHFKFDVTKPLPWDSKTTDTVRVIADMIKGQNEKIREAHRQAIDSRSSAAYEVQEYDDLDSDFE